MVIGMSDAMRPEKRAALAALRRKQHVESALLTTPDERLQAAAALFEFARAMGRLDGPEAEAASDADWRLLCTLKDRWRTLGTGR